MDLGVCGLKLGFTGPPPLFLSSSKGCVFRQVLLSTSLVCMVIQRRQQKAHQYYL